MKRLTIVCALALILTLSLSACAAYEAAPAMEATPEPEASWDFDFAEDAPSFEADWDDIVAEEEAPAPMSTPAPADSSDALEETLSQSIEYGESPGAPPILTPSDAGWRRLIYTVDMQLQTTEFMHGIRLLYDTIGELNGFLLNEQVQGRDLRTPDVERSANYMIRLYTDNLPQFIVIMEDNFNLLSRGLASDEITGIYEHVGVTLDDMRDIDSQLRDELNDPELEDDDRREIEQFLSEITTHIRDLERQQATMDDDIHFSFINIRLFEVIFVEEVEEKKEEVIEPTFGERFSEAASRSWAGFLGFGQGLLILFIRALPALLILVAITIVICLIVRKYKKWRKANPKPEKPTPPPYNNQNWHSTQQQHYNQNTAQHNTNTQNINPNANNKNNPD